ncbi:TetR/AcrR family transcriptional regulator [Adlercreutzia equolifaciens]|uniref:TetR/AcrR family transcriptional regulator n=1 Tax=Adlercreutzia equolifaciens TaxID=446660 RepID=UPI0023AF175D|nr:TetR/AcrR family transcriptional regulator [Adlercreutzia equolifaciens]MDE8701788.1 TetR/AcrR family transcriptional regulator [Adlercreutzia equolifaciens]
MGKAEAKYLNTAKRMDAALLRLLDTKEFDQISVTEICGEAGVNRSTFYAHYANTAELLGEVKQNALEEFFSSFKHLAGSRDFLGRDYLLAYLGFLQENSTVFRVMLSNAELFSPDSIFLDFKDLLAQGVFLEDGALVMYADYKLRFVVSGITSLVAAWLEGGCRETKERMVDIIIECVGMTQR